MPLMKGKSEGAFKHNLKAEMAAGKPMKQSLAIAYSHKRKSKKMADGGMAYEDGGTTPSPSPTPGSIIVQPHQFDKDAAAAEATLKEKGQVQGKAEGGMIENQDPVHPMDSLMDSIVDRIMARRSPDYSADARLSEGGQVANETEPYADSMPAEFDDLVLRDDLESSYGDDDNAGDSLGNDQEDEDRHDIVSRIMASRRKKDRMPRPA